MSEKPSGVGNGRAEPDDVKSMRLEYPTGWIELAGYQARVLMLDAILDSPEEYEFTNPDLAERAGLSAEAVRQHIDTLVDLGIVNPQESRKYKVSKESPILQQVRDLNRTVNQVRAGTYDPHRPRRRVFDREQLADRLQNVLEELEGQPEEEFSPEEFPGAEDMDWSGTHIHRRKADT